MHCLTVDHASRSTTYTLVSSINDPTQTMLPTARLGVWSRMLYLRVKRARCGPLPRIPSHPVSKGSR